MTSAWARPSWQSGTRNAGPERCVVDTDTVVPATLRSGGVARQTVAAARMRDVTALSEKAAMLTPRMVCVVLPSALWCLSTAASAGGFVDLGVQEPGSPTICSAVRALRQGGREPQIAAHSLPEKGIEPTFNLQNSMTDAAWAEATAGDYGITHCPADTLARARVELTTSTPEAWVYSTEVGSLHDPVLWVFSSTPDGSKPAHLVAQLGFEGSGPFDTYFVRFKDKPYVVTRSGGEKGSYLDVYRLDPAKVVCPFSPP